MSCHLHFCKSTVDAGRGAHKCEHGNACHFKGAMGGAVDDWTRPNCEACYARLKRDGELKPAAASAVHPR